MPSVVRFVVVLALLTVACNAGVDEASDALESRPPPTPSPSASASPSGSPSPTDDTIEVTTPQPGDEIRSPVQISGEAEVFEGTVTIRIVDASDRELAAGFATATCGSGCRGSFSTELFFFTELAQSGTVEVFEESAEDGSALHVVSIPVTLVPGT